MSRRRGWPRRKRGVTLVVVGLVALLGVHNLKVLFTFRACFPKYEYVSLEPLDVRDFASQDPRGFLAQHDGETILDEVQRAPELFSYLQEELDRDPCPGRYILTGSQHFGLSEAVSQSLAGRIAPLHLLPLSLDEVERFPETPVDLWSTVWTGGYPRIHDRRLSPDRWLADYVATYVQRDVRQVLNVTDLDAFTALLRLAAGRTAQELHLSALGGDAGVSHPTVRSWISVLETSFVVFRAPPWFRNTRKRTIKAPKIHFVEADSGPVAVEVRSGATVASDFFKGFWKLRERTGEGAALESPAMRLVYGGETEQRRSGVDVVPWHQIQERSWL